MFPHAAGKIASNGPYEKVILSTIQSFFYFILLSSIGILTQSSCVSKQVSDIYSIPGLTKNDKTLFKMYEDQFTVNPPGRAFKERINARVST